MCPTNVLSPTKVFYTVPNWFAACICLLLMCVLSGGNCLMIDEDTAATNFMIRDDKIQMLLSADKEPIKPYLYRARELHDK